MTTAATDELSFGVLGPLEVRRGDRVVEIGGVKQRTVLATLLLNANRTVTFDQLIEAVWPDSPPRSAVGNLYTYVSGLRRALPSGDRRIRKHPSGYSMAVQPHELDLHAFEDLAARALGRRAEERPAEALDLLERASTLWRGELLEDLPPNPVWEADLARLAEGRLAANEERLDLLVELGRYATAISEAQALLHGHPFRERIWQQLMLALYHSGRRAEALRTYVEVRGRLIEELGVEPGPELRRTQAMILAEDAAAGADDDRPGSPLAPSRPTSPRPTPPRTRSPAAQVPVTLGTTAPVYQLPPDIPDFSGRTESVRELADLLAGAQGAPGRGTAPTIVVIAGPPGVGKSTLALHVAHAIRAAFPDGQLYADLAGTTPLSREPGELLAEALRALGVPGGAIPKSLSEKAALYRTRLADRRVLVMLDDAASAAQVRSLLPTTAGCAVIITSRYRLAELPGAHLEVLDALHPDEARDLIGRIVGLDRTEREPAETAAILRACGYLPLAIRIAGAKLAGRRSWTLQVLRERLADESQRISELQVGELGVRAGFEMSMTMLSAEAARTFRLLGLLGAQTFPGWVVHALVDRRGANDVLDALLDAHLLQLADVDATGRPRYRLHDLLRAYAREQAADEPPELRRAALGRAFGCWLALAEQAADRLPATVNRAAPGNAPRWPLDHGVAAQLVAAPRDWFESERRSLFAAIELAAADGMDEFAWELAACLVPYLDHLSLHEDWRHSHDQALPAVRAAGNRRGEAALLRGLGQLNVYVDDYYHAVRDFTRSRELSQEVDDKRGEAWAIAGLGTVERLRHRYEEAADHYLEALSAFTTIEDRHLEAQIHNSIGTIRMAQGRLDEARGWFDTALSISEEAGDDFRAALVLINIGDLHRTEHDPGRALDYQGRALAALERIDDEQSLAYALLSTAETYLALDDRANVAAACDRAKAIFIRIGDRGGERACARLLDTRSPEA
jgi:DNA-binding SARP family transcriptional activator